MRGPMSFNSYKKIIYLLLLVLTLFYGAGCRDRREPDLLGIVTVIGFDLDPQTGYIKMLASVANPSSGGSSQDQSSGSGGGGQKPPFWVVEAAGRTVFQASKNLEVISSRELRWSHVDVILFSEKLARERGIGPVLDYFDRERQSRPISVPLVVQGDLKKFMESMYPLEQNSGTALAKQVRSIRLESARIPETDSLIKVFGNLARPGKEVVLPLVKFVTEGGEGSLGTGAPNPAKISGSALFKGDKLLDFFNERETAGYLWLTGNVDIATYVIRCPGSEEDFFSVEVDQTATEIKSLLKDGKLRFQVSVQAEGRMQDFNCENPPRSQWDEEFIAALNRRLATAIRNQMEMSLDKARQAGVDVFGLGNLLYRTHPVKWKELEGRWGEIFPTVAVDIEVQAIIRRHGLVLDRFKIN